MAPSYRSFAATGGGASPRTVNKPSGVVAGDLLILHVGTSDNVTPSVPAGFTLIPGAEIAAAPSIRLYSKVAGGSEPSTYDVTFPSGTANVAMSAYFGAAALVVDDLVVNAATGKTWLGITTTVIDALLLCFATIPSLSGNTADALMTERYESASAATCLYLMTEARPAAGATGTRTVTSSAGAGTAFKKITMALAEASPVDPPDAPSGLTATPLTASRIDLAWSHDGVDTTSYSVERSANGTTGWVEVGTPAVTTFSNTGLATNTTYYYRVAAAGPGGTSSFSAVVSALTLNPGRAPITPRLYLWQPEVVFAARVNWPSATYPIDLFDVDGVTVGSISDVKAGMTILLGSAPGLDDYGRQRVRKDGAGARLFVGRSSRGTHDGELTVVDNAYVTVWDLRLLWAKVPYIAPPVAGVAEIFKDSDIPVEDHTEFPDPVANTGAGTAATIDADTGLITVLFNGQRSFAVAPGATLVSFLWDIKDGTLTTGALTDDFITATFPAGRRYVELTVTDSNGNSHTASCPVYARDPDNDTSFSGFDIEGQIRVADGGQTITIRALEDMPRLTYPDGTLALMWDREPNANAERDHMLIIGWLDTENAQSGSTKTGVLRDTTLTILDGAAKLDTLPGFPQAMADDASRDTEKIPNITWNYAVAPNLDWYIVFLLYYHSTALEVLDFVPSGRWEEYPFALMASDGESLWNQVDRRARAFVPDCVLTCDRLGRLAVVPDPQLQEVADRTAEVQAAITENDYSDIRFSRERKPRVHWLRGGAIKAQAYADLPLVAGVKTIETFFSIAPGDTPGQGMGEMTQGEQLALSQADFNAAIGHRYARANAPFGFLTLTLVQDDGGAGVHVPWRELEPAFKEWVTVDLSAEFAAQRGWTFTTVRGLPRELSIRYNRSKTGTTRTIELTVEVETVGEPGTTVIKPTVPPVGEDPVTPPVVPAPDFGLIEGQELVAGIGSDGYIYRTSSFQTDSGSGGPTWDRVDTTIADTIYSFVVDPFSPGYIDGAGAINGWIANDTDIYRVTDLFGSVAATSVFTFDEPTVGASFHWRSIQASFGAFFAEGINPWLMCVSYYGDAAGHTGTWATYSVDGGVTWASEVQISVHYNTTTPTRFNGIGVYCSPKTAGLAYTAAYSETAVDAQAVGYVSTNWGATWAAYTAIDAGSGNAGSIHLPWPDNASENIIYHGQLLTTGDEGTTEELMPVWAKYEASSSTLTQLGANIQMAIEAHAEVLDGGGDSTGNIFLMYGPPPEAIRVNSTVIWSAYRSSDGGFGSQGLDLAGWPHSGITRTSGTNNYSDPAANSSSSGSFSLVHERDDPSVGGTWTINNTNLDTAPWSSTNRVQYSITAALASVQAGHHWVNHVQFTWLIAEIELENGTIYTPTLPSGDRSFRLKQLTSGVSADISPDDGGIFFGINDYGFTVRSFDSDRQYMALAGIGNDTSGDVADDLVGLWTSVNAGSAWANILAPVAAANAPRGLQVAFGGDSSDILFAWGGKSDGSIASIYYSSDMGALLDSREGNISSLGTTTFIGIAGGIS